MPDTTTRNINGFIFNGSEIDKDAFIDQKALLLIKSNYKFKRKDGTTHQYESVDEVRSDPELMAKLTSVYEASVPARAAAMYNKNAPEDAKQSVLCTFYDADTGLPVVKLNAKDGYDTLGPVNATIYKKYTTANGETRYSVESVRFKSIEEAEKWAKGASTITYDILGQNTGNDKLTEDAIVSIETEKFSKELANSTVIGVSDKETADRLARLGDLTTCRGGGVPAVDSDKNSIMTFAEFLATLAFAVHMDSAFVVNGLTTLHDYIAKNLQRFYHQMYYIPNLQNNMCIVVKPETLFIQAPSCNVIYPNMKNAISFNRNFVNEPTRIIQVTDPVYGIPGDHQMGNSCLVTMQFIDQEKYPNETRYGMPLYKTKVVTHKDFKSLTEKKANPMAAITSYEKENGIRGYRSTCGEDLYLYLVKGGKSNEHFVVNDKDLPNAQAALVMLAHYELHRKRYVGRTGSAMTYFDPYLVPGFPFMSVESSSEGCNIYGYITDIAHNLTDRQWTTTVNFNCAHYDNENSPIAFPIVEAEYAQGIADTYKNMLGDTVKPVSNTDVPRMIDDYFSTRKQYLSTSFRKVWRPLTDFEDYIGKILGGGKVIQMKNYCFIDTGSDGFFRPELQNRIKQYSESIMNKQMAMSNSDIR